MNLLAFLKPRRSHTEVRYVVATREESRCVRQARADKRLELEIMAVHLTPEQRAAAKLRAANSRSMENGRGRG